MFNLKHFLKSCNIFINSVVVQNLVVDFYLELFYVYEKDAVILQWIFDIK